MTVKTTFTDGRDRGRYHHSQSSLGVVTPSANWQKRSVDLVRCFHAALLATCRTSHVLTHPSVKAFLARISRDPSYHRVKVLKSALTELRLNTLRGTPTPRSVRGLILPRCLIDLSGFNTVMQYTRCARALPPPPAETRAKALEEQSERLCHQGDEPRLAPEILKTIQELPDAGDIPPLSSGDLISSSSCMERNRAQGGRTSLLAEVDLHAHVDQRVAWHLLSTPFNPRSGLHRSVDVAQKICADVKDSSLSDCEAVALPELGNKWRVVTRHHATLVANSHRGRQLLFSYLRNIRHVTTAESLRDPELARIPFTKVKKSREHFVFSADLTAATDMLSHTAIDAVCTKFGIPLWWVIPSTLDGRAVRRGTCMGIPCSWPVLSLVHYAVCKTVDRKHNFRLKGDDLIAYWTKAQIARYTELIASTGMQLNHSKTVVSRLHGVFCEVTYNLKGHTLLRAADYPLRSFVKDTPLAPDQWQMLLRHGARLPDLHRMFRWFHTKWIRAAARSKVPRYLPPSLGGLGFPPRTMEHQLSTRESVCVRACHNGISPHVEDTGLSGPFMKQLLRFLDKEVREVTDGDKDAAVELRRRAHIVMGRAAFVDALRGNATPVNPERLGRIVKMRARRFRSLSVLVEPYPTTVEKAYDVISRLGLSQASASMLRTTSSSNVLARSFKTFCPDLALNHNEVQRPHGAKAPVGAPKTQNLPGRCER